VFAAIVGVAASGMIFWVTELFTGKDSNQWHVLIVRLVAIVIAHIILRIVCIMMDFWD